MTPSGEIPPRSIVGSLQRTLWTGAAVAGAFFAGFGGWAALAPLSGAAVAPAVVSPDGNRRTVQHLEGGVVRELLVREGSAVEAGQQLIVLDASAARAAYEVLHKDFWLQRAKQWRLTGERADAKELSFPAEPFAGEDASEIHALYEAEYALFASRRDAREERKQVLRQKAVQLREEIEGLRQQILAQTRQLGLVQEEMKTVAPLVDKGYERRPRLLALQRTEAEILGARAGNQAAIAKALSAIDETGAQIDTIDSQHQERVETELTDVTAKLGELQKKLPAAADVLARTTISAPVSGTVVELGIHTVGGVVTAGKPILHIVPRDEELLVDARISPRDIDEVRPELPAQVVITSYQLRNAPRLEGRVREVSADRIVDQRTGENYYLARIELPAEKVRDISPSIRLKAGMPAEVMVMTGERTLLGYLLEPLLASFRKSFRES